ncbi:Lipid-A-disaccharide synthase, partial [Haemophilus influenzae]
AF